SGVCAQNRMPLAAGSIRAGCYRTPCLKNSQLVSACITFFRDGGCTDMRIAEPRSKRVAVGLAGADADGVIEVHDKNLAVPDLSRAGRGCDGLHGLRRAVGRHRDLDPQLGQEIHGIFGAAVDLGMALLSPV